MSAAEPLALVLSGGGARGAFQAGAWETLVVDGRFAHPTILSGTSAGALNAALIAAGRKPHELRDFWFSFATDPPAAGNALLVRAFLSQLVGLVRQNGASLTGAFLRRLRARRLRALNPIEQVTAVIEVLLLDRFDLVSRVMNNLDHAAVLETANLRARVVEYLGGESVTTKDYRVGISAVDLRSRSYVRYVLNAPASLTDAGYLRVDAITADMLVGSAAVPILLAASQVLNALLWDGGLLVTTPMSPAVALGAQAIVPILVSEAPEELTEPAPASLPMLSMAETIESLIDTLVDNTYHTDRRLLLGLNGNPKYRPIKLYQAVRPQALSGLVGGNYFDFTLPELKRLYALGQETARRWLAAGPTLDSDEKPAAPPPPPPRPPAPPPGPPDSGARVARSTPRIVDAPAKSAAREQPRRGKA